MSVLPGELIPSRDSSRRPGPTRVPRVAVAAVLCASSLALLLGVFQAFFRDPWSMLDLRVYLWGGDIARRLDDPYLPTYLHTGLHFTYAPIAAGLFALLAVIKAPIVKVLVTAASVASLAGVLWLTWGRLGYSASSRRLSATLCAAAVSLWLEPVRQTLSFGQINLVLMLIIVADLCMPDDRWWKGIGVGLAAGIKLTPLIFIPYLLLTRRYRAAAVATATFSLTIAISLVALPAAAEDYWLDGLFLNANRLGGIRYIGNQSLNGAMLRLFGSSAAGQPYRLGIEVIVALTGLLLAASVSRRGQEMAGILICALTGLLVSPVSWTHHWVWVAPALVVLADLAMSPSNLPASRPERWRRWLAITAVVTVVAVFSGVLWAEPAPATQGYVMTGPEQLIGDLYVLAGLVSLSVIAVLMAHVRWRERARTGLAVQATSG
ncbi:MAG TPA: glycosyltransferase 87 family protein [Streptosporangiaceae bacterium]|nr:glycosyltransferase 87 family protein [Streptosporangiaceae bacterium]